MSSKPKKEGPSAADKASASVAMAEYNRFKQKYDPLLRKMRDESLTEDTTSTLRARSNADTMQALTSNMSLQGAQRTDAGSDMAQAVQGQLGQATKAGKQIQNQMQTNVLGTARGQAADAQSGMAQAARLSTSEALARAKAKNDVSLAKFNAAAQIGTALVGQGLENASTKGAGGAQGSFFRPVDSGGNEVKGFKNRLQYSGVIGRS
jgi:hypothetical protein